jgi:hypothetical protein
VGYNRPHTPLYVPDNYFERFPLDEIEIPEHYYSKTDLPPKITQALHK